MNGIILDSLKFINLQVRLRRIGCQATEHPLVLRGQAGICPFSLLFVTITGAKLGVKGAALFLGVCFRFN